MKTLVGDIALVTGGTGGIGSAIGLALRDEGVQVCLTGRTVPERTADPIHFIQADLSSPADVDRIADSVLARHDQLGILVHSAASLHYSPLATTDLDALDEMYRVNLRAPLRLTQRLLPALIRAQGQVVFLNSSAAMFPPDKLAGYAATKSALRSFADALRVEVNPLSVRVLSVFCGRVATRMQAKMCEQEQRPYDPSRLLQPSDVASAVVSALALPRTAELTNLQIRPMQKS